MQFTQKISKISWNGGTENISLQLATTHNSKQTALSARSVSFTKDNTFFPRKGQVVYLIPPLVCPEQPTDTSFWGVIPAMELDLWFPLEVHWYLKIILTPHFSSEKLPVFNANVYSLELNTIKIQENSNFKHLDI